VLDAIIRCVRCSVWERVDDERRWMSGRTEEACFNEGGLGGSQEYAFE
jgi:hypothetical protein